MKLLPKELIQIKNHGLTVEKIEQDLRHFQNGFPKLKVIKPATLNDGIVQILPKQKQILKDLYQASELEVLKFVPASGAASRMFKLLHQFLDEYPKENLCFEKFINQDLFKELKVFFEALPHIVFYDDLILALKGGGVDLEALSRGNKALELTRQMLADDCFQMAELPKGLIPFHKYPEEKLTAFEEHFYEASTYAVKYKKAKLHFTISKNHLDKFQHKWKEFQPKIELETGVDFKVNFSFQHSSTDTVCLNADGDLYRDSDGNILLRPAGHGALIENLNRLKVDLVFIKNIDNVTHQNSVLESNSSTSEYKSVLAGLLIQLQEKTFSFLKKLETDAENDDLLKAAISFLKKDLNVFSEIKNREEVIRYLNRPIRVCGMVTNEGAPGGGPFWILNEDGSTSLQIVEKSQIDLTQSDQKEKMEASTHFNPVDIVCGLKNYKGEFFDLKQFVDTNKGFIATKFVGGEAVKALELPGLWNGGMAFWNTVFVEVPAESFNPVKTVTDLLKVGHQPRSHV